MKSKIDNNLRNAKNIGATIEKYLNEIGIFTLADLAETTSVKAFIKIREQHPEKTIPVCYYLYSLEGALLNLHWNAPVPKHGNVTYLFFWYLLLHLSALHGY